MAEDNEEMRSFSLTPTWSVATVLTIFIAVSLLLERLIHHLSSWLQKTNRKPLFEALEQMKEELMLLGFMSLLLTATSRTISNICIHSKFYEGTFSPCSRSEAENMEEDSPQGRKLWMGSVLHHSLRRGLSGLNENTCKEACDYDHEPFVSYEGMEQLHRFIFVMAVTHIFYSCLTMLLAIVKIHTWRKWEDEAHIDRHDAFPDRARESTMRRQSMYVKFHLSNPWGTNGLLVWVVSFFRQFGHSVRRTDYLTLRMAFITNHNLTLRYDFHSYMVRSMEEEFQRIVGVSVPLWGFVVAFMLFDVNGADLYFWLAIIPITLVLVLGTKLQQIIATLVWENAGVTGFFMEARLRPRDDLFWFKKPELILSLIHFVLFQNAFELATFFWFWWQFGYRSCFLENHWLVYIRLILGFAGQFLCSYSTLPLYALVTQMGTNYKAALIPDRVRETIHGWNKEAKKRRRRGIINDDSTVHTETSTVISVEDDEFQSPSTRKHAEIELEPISTIKISSPSVASESSSRVGTPLLKNSASVFSPAYSETPKEDILRSPSMPIQRRGSM
ncbi:Mlo-related protein [Macleaya cordata]|uniref:MLO-like protein n=1 Tax=Macleaya cordata TaxID=56857 RepID=A0A200PQV7_MACCD|nr:Mlo-related protein [Macleaya cordata]